MYAGHNTDNEQNTDFSLASAVAIGLPGSTGRLSGSASTWRDLARM
jgi:hypothetical protein